MKPFLRPLQRLSPSCLIHCSFLLLLLLLLAGCGKQEVYQVDDERTANTIVSILLSKDIEAKKISLGSGIWSIRVHEVDFATSVDILDWYGVPEKSFPALQQFYQKSGLVSTPQEQRARYMNALSLGLSETLCLINGVIDARCHVVLPQNDPFSGQKSPASAAVFIKHRQLAQIDDMIPQVKQLVSNSIEGLDYERVSVSTFPSLEWSMTEIDRYGERATFMGIEVLPGSVDLLRFSVLAYLFLIGLLCLLCAFLLWRLIKKNVFGEKIEEPLDQPSETQSTSQSKPAQAEPQSKPAEEPEGAEEVLEQDEEDSEEEEEDDDEEDEEDEA